MTGDTAYYHGGRPGLAAGDHILPPVETGSRTLTAVMLERVPWMAAELGITGYRADEVSFTTNLHIATLYASLWSLDPARPGDGAVYRVRPAGRKRPLDDLGRDWTARRAVITTVADPAVSRDPAREHWSDRADDWAAAIRAIDRGHPIGGIILMRHWQAVAPGWTGWHLTTRG